MHWMFLMRMVLDRAKSFLNNMMPDIEAANLELQIKAQEEVVAKAEKKLRDLKDDQTSLERKLQENKSDQENTQKDIENQKQALGNTDRKKKKNDCKFNAVAETLDLLKMQSLLMHGEKQKGQLLVHWSM